MPRSLRRTGTQGRSGTLLFQVCQRLIPRDFRWPAQGRTRNGGWIWSVKGAVALRCRIACRSCWSGSDNVIVIPEGERDVDALWKLGIAATCNAGGAGKWHPDLSVFFKGGDVVVIPDYDPQKKHPKTGALMFHPDGRPILSGQNHAADVARHLTGVAARVRVLELWKSWPDMPPKGDVSDWIENGGTVEQLYELIDQVPDWKPEQASDESDPVDLWGFVRTADIAARSVA